MAQTEEEAPGHSVSVAPNFVMYVLLAHDCLTWPRRTHRARRRTTAAFYGRAPRARAPVTPDTRCPCATHDRYSSRTLLKRIMRIHNAVPNPAATLFFYFHTFLRFRCSTMYDLHTNGLLWCFIKLLYWLLSRPFRSDNVQMWSQTGYDVTKPLSLWMFKYCKLVAPIQVMFNFFIINY